MDGLLGLVIIYMIFSFIGGLVQKATGKDKKNQKNTPQSQDRQRDEIKQNKAENKKKKTGQGKESTGGFWDTIKQEIERQEREIQEAQQQLYKPQNSKDKSEKKRQQKPKAKPEPVQEPAYSNSYEGFSMNKRTEDIFDESIDKVARAREFSIVGDHGPADLVLEEIATDTPQAQKSVTILDLSKREELSKVVLYAEILGQPVSMRENHL